jgi:uncharacterized protein (TIGR03437 family)
MITPAQAIDAKGTASIAQNLSAGGHTIAAVYNGDINFLPSPSGSYSFSVSKADTSLTLTANPGQVNQPISIRAAVATLAPSHGAVTGTVDFTSGGVAMQGCTGVLVLSGVATCSTTVAKMGSYSVSAAYSGDSNTNRSSASFVVTVGKVVAGTYAGVSPDSPIYGQSVILTAQLIGAAGVATPSGNITFNLGSASLPSVALGSDGRAQLAIPSAVLPQLTAGSYSLSVSYAGDDNYQSSKSDALAFAVAKADTSVTVTSPAPQYGQPVTLKAIVSLRTAGGVLAGTVTFSNGVNQITGCTALPLADGAAACTTTFTQSGNISITGLYSGDTNTSASSGTTQLTINRAAATVSTAVNPTSPVFGAPVTISASVTVPAGSPAATGTVAFAEGSANLGNITLGADGRAAVTVPSGSLAPLSVGSHSLTVTYGGDTNYQAPQPVPVTIVVAKAPTAVTVTSGLAQLAQPLVLKASVTVTSPAVATPAGTVDFTNAGAAVVGCTGVALQGGIATCNTTMAQMGTFAIAAAYNGDANTAASAGSLQLTVGKVVAGVYTASIPSAPVYGDKITINALLMGATGVPVPGGNVTFTDGANALATIAVGSDGRASLVLPSGTLPVLATGSHTVVGTYNGDANYISSAATPLTITVGKAATSTSLAGGSSLTATVTSTAGSPTGTVQFFVNGGSIGSSSLGGNGVATLAPPSQSGTAWAVYQGDANFSGSASQTISLAQTPTVTISSDHNPSSSGQSVAFTARVAGTSGMATPTGSVQFSSDNGSLGTVTLASGVATFNATLAVGSHVVTASYSGDSVYAPATGTMTQVVNRSSVTVTLTSSAASAVYGQPVTLTAQLAAQGTVQFLDGAVTIGASPAPSGLATLVVSTLSVGTHTITASWAGDSNNAGAVSTPVTVTVDKAKTTTTLQLSGSTLRVTVAAVAPGAGVPTGTVKFLDISTGAELASAALSSGAGSAPAPSPARSLAAVYSGDANFAGSTSSSLTPLSVLNAASYTTQAVAPDAIVTLFGTDFSVLTVSAPTPLTPLGGATVTLLDSKGASHSAKLMFVSPNQASFLTPTDLPTGPGTVTLTNVNQVAVSTPVIVTTVAPGLFTRNASGQGVPAGQSLRVHANGSQDPALDLASFDNVSSQWVPALINLGVSTDTTYLVLYGTGLRHHTTPVTCTMAGLQVPVAYAGTQPAFPGLDQVNVALPMSLRSAGAVDVTLSVDGVVSNTVTINVQ